MRELTYTLLGLERSSWKTCDFCSNHYEDNKSVNQIVARIKVNGKYVADGVVCEDCKEKFEIDELEKCERCGRLQTKHHIDICGDKYVCFCIRYKEDMEEKELPDLPYESQAVSYEQQINGLREELNTAEWTIYEEREVHEDFMKTSEEWSKKQKQELLDKIKELEEENVNYKDEIKKLKMQLEQLTSQQQVAQIEVKKWSWLKIRK